MKLIAINGSPRRNRNTATLLEYAADGARAVGAEAEVIHLHELQYTGCISCFSCKLKEGGTPGMCAADDDLRPVLKAVMAADALVVGSPIYCADVSAGTRAFLERLQFMNVSYEALGASYFDGYIPAGFIYTMNAPRIGAFIYSGVYRNNEKGLRALGGRVRRLLCCNTYQFDDYSRYTADLFDENQRALAKVRDFPLSCQKAFELGKKLIENKRKR